MTGRNRKVMGFQNNSLDRGCVRWWVRGVSSVHFFVGIFGNYSFAKPILIDMRRTSLKKSF